MKTQKKTFTGLTVLLLLFIAAAAMAPTASAAWDSYRVIEIDNTQVSGSSDLNSFPVLISLTEDWLKHSDHQGDVKEEHGYDIVFTNADNSSLLDYEIEEYDGTAGTLVAWVRIPTLKHGENTMIRLWYGNSAATDWSNPTGVWDTNYKGVWHLNETTGGTDAIKDSTSNDHDGTDHGSPNLDVAGPIDGADDFDGTDDYVNIPSTSALKISGDLTAMGWFSWGGSTGDNQYGLRKNDNYDLLQILDNNAVRAEIYTDSWQVLSYNVVGADIQNKWTHFAITYNGSSFKLYYNGALANQDSISGTLYTNDQPLHIGSVGFRAQEFYKGAIDEIRISDMARSGDWIKTEYNNQNSPSTFYEVKGPTDTGGSDPVPELPTIILLAVGLVVLTGYVWLRRKNK